MKLSLGNEPDTPHRTSFRKLRNSYFALIPVLNWERGRNHHTERTIIKIIRKSDICKSNPVLKALLIENVRIFCIVIESSGKRSSKILCASAPYIFSLVSKANPKLESLLKSERISSCLSVLQQSDLESLLVHAYQTTIIIHKGVKRFYPLLCVSLLRDFVWFSETSIVYLLNLGLYILQSCIELFYDNVRPFIYYLCRQNYELASYIADCIPQLILSSFKSSIAASAYSKNAVVFILQFIKKIVSCLSDIVTRISKDSSVYTMAKNISLYLKYCMTYLRSTDTCSLVEQKLSHLVYASKPYILKYLKKSFIVIRDFIRSHLPLVKDSILYSFKEGTELLKKIIDENLVDILNVYNSIKIFLSENRHQFIPLCCTACHYLYKCIIYLYKVFQATLPYIIQFSSNSIISLIMCSNIALDYCVHICAFAYICKTFIFETQKELFCHISGVCFSILKNVYKVLLKMQPYMVLIFRVFFSELTKLTHALAPTSLACLQEMNSSLLHASKEVVSKSCLAVKCILPSFYYTVKAVVPPTVHAAHEVIKSSTNFVVIVYPSIFRSLLTIRPELEEGIIVLIMDGNKACLEVMSVTFSASCELKDTVFTVSSNLPVVYRALREVLSTTSHAVVEVSVTSTNAKARMLKDIKRAHDTVHASFLLAEQEIIAVYMEALFQINAILPILSNNYLIRNDTYVKKYVVTFIYNLLVKSLKIVNIISKYSLNVASNFAGNAVPYFRDFIKALVYVPSCLVPVACSMTSHVLPQKIYKGLYVAVVSSLSHIYTIINYKIMPHINYLCKNMLSKFSDLSSEVVLRFCESMPKVWYAFKFSVHRSWDAVCLFSPQVWAVFECLTSMLWEFCMENIPLIWIAWKGFCVRLWEVIYDLAPHVWQYSSSVVPVVWSSLRMFVKKFWIYCIDSSRLMWQQITSLSSEYWMLSNTYLPSVWFASCASTRKGWNASCFLIENCWAFAVETCLISWKFLHHSVAKSWNSSLAITKSAYFALSTSSTVLQKSVCLCIKSKNCIYVIFKVKPRINDLSNETDPSHNASSVQLHSSSTISNCISPLINIFHKFDRMLNFDTFIPSKIFRKNFGKVDFY